MVSKKKKKKQIEKYKKEEIKTKEKR